MFWHAYCTLSTIGDSLNGSFEQGTFLLKQLVTGRPNPSPLRRRGAATHLAIQGNKRHCSTACWDVRRRERET